MIYQTKESIPFTATHDTNKFKTARGRTKFDFWKSCDEKIAFPVNVEKEIKDTTDREQKFQLDMEKAGREFIRSEKDKLINSMADEDEIAYQQLQQKWQEIYQVHKTKFYSDQEKIEKEWKKKKERADSTHHIVYEKATGNVYVLVQFADIKFKRKIMLSKELVERCYKESSILYGKWGGDRQPLALTLVLLTFTILILYVYTYTGDTDSVMCNFWLPNEIWEYTDAETMKDIPEGEAREDKLNEIRTNVVLGFVSCLSIKAAEYCSSLCPDPNNLAFEKICWPFLLLSCKRYIYEKFELGWDSSKGIYI